MREFKNVILENCQTGDCSSEALSGRIGGSLTIKFFLDLKLLNPLRQLNFTFRILGCTYCTNSGLNLGLSQILLLDFTGLKIAFHCFAE